MLCVFIRCLPLTALSKESYSLDMYITTPKRKGGITVVRLVHGFRKDGKVKTKIIKTIGQSRDPDEIEYLKKLAVKEKMEWDTGIKQKPVVPDESIRLSCLRGEAVINDGVPDVLGCIYKRLAFKDIISGTRKDKLWNKLLKYCLFIRFLEPASKLRSVQLIQNRFQKLFSHDQVLRMMDHLSKNEEKIKDHIFRVVMEKSQSLELVLFDVTTLYFENVTESDLKQFGFSKDNKFNEVQVVLALLTDGQGLPLTYEVFPGNTAETKTLISCLEKLSDKYHIKRVRLTADRALFSKKNLSYFEEKDENQEDRRYEYIIACPLRKLSEKQKQKILDRSHYKRIDEVRSFFEFSHEGRKYVAGYSAKRAEHDRYKRERILEKARKLENKEGKIPTNKLSGYKGISKYVQRSKGFVRIREKAVLEDAKWDGIFGVCTNIKILGAKELFSSYKKLWKIEESFRINKHTLKMRPIYHQLSRRIKAHIMMCFLTYTLLRYGELFLKSKGLSYGPQEFIDILSGIEKWVAKDIKTGRWYVIPRRISMHGSRIYKAFGIEYCRAPYRLITPLKT